MADLLDRLYWRIEERQGLGRTVQPVYSFINNPDHPDNAEKLAAAERWQRDNPSGLLIERFIVGDDGRSPSSVATDETLH